MSLITPQRPNKKYYNYQIFRYKIRHKSLGSRMETHLNLLCGFYEKQAQLRIAVSPVYSNGLSMLIHTMDVTYLSPYKNNENTNTLTYIYFTLL